jgi:hypothetical protein
LFYDPCAERLVSADDLSDAPSHQFVVELPMQLDHDGNAIHVPALAHPLG